MQNTVSTTKGSLTGFIPYCIGKFWMWINGWKVEGAIPEGKKFILVGAPHTSNWDFAHGMAAVYIYRLKVSWLGKHTIFKRPFSGFMKWLGGIPVKRKMSHGLVDEIAKHFAQKKELIIAMSPPGTRGKTEYWKSGFYWMALKAQVPILCAALDYGKKRVTLGLSFMPTGNVRNDMERIREFYRGIQGKRPELETGIRLKEEE